MQDLSEKCLRVKTVSEKMKGYSESWFFLNPYQRNTVWCILGKMCYNSNIRKLRQRSLNDAVSNRKRIIQK